MEIITFGKALKLFGNDFWKVLVVGSILASLFGLAIPDSIKQYWLYYIIAVLFLSTLVSLVLLVIKLIKANNELIKDRVPLTIPDELLQILQKMPQEQSEVLSNAVDRYFHLYGYQKERIKLGNLLNENRKINNQVTNLIDQLGWANYLNNQVTEAYKNIAQGIKLAEKNHLYYWAAKGERHLSGIERHRGNKAAFQEHMKKANDYCALIVDNSEKTEMEGSLHLAEAKYLLQEKTDLNKAEIEANQAMTLFANDIRRQLKVYVVLGNIYLEQELWDQAYNKFKEGYDKSFGIRNDERAKNALGLAKIHLKPDIPRFFKTNKAKEYLQEAELYKESLKRHEIEEIESLINGLT